MLKVTGENVLVEALSEGQPTCVIKRKVSETVRVFGLDLGLLTHCAWAMSVLQQCGCRGLRTIAIVLCNTQLLVSFDVSSIIWHNAR